MTGDWDWNGRDTIGVFRATGTYTEWRLPNYNNTGDPSITPFSFGVISDKAMTGDWN